MFTLHDISGIITQTGMQHIDSRIKSKNIKDASAAMTPVYFTILTNTKKVHEWIPIQGWVGAEPPPLTTYTVCIRTWHDTFVYESPDIPDTVISKLIADGHFVQNQLTKKRKITDSPATQQKRHKKM